MLTRQLIAVVLAASGCVLFGCSAGETNAVFAPTDTGDQPSGNPDQPRSGTDQARPNPDAPPSNPDAPPAASGGAGLSGLCHQLCGRLQECPGGGTLGFLSPYCREGCVVPEFVLPCESELVGLLNCMVALPTLCAREGEQGEQMDYCTEAAKAYSKCSDKSEPVDGPGDGPPQRSCTLDGGCECPSECASCVCENGSAAAATECLEVCTTQ